MISQSLYYLEHVCTGISIFAVSIIILGMLYTSLKYLWYLGRLSPETNFKQFKVGFGSVLTLSLEILVFSDVINTILVKPTLQSLGFLMFIIVIRTIVSWALTLETTGQWPWNISQEQGND